MERRPECLFRKHRGGKPLEFANYFSSDVADVLEDHRQFECFSIMADNSNERRGAFTRSGNDPTGCPCKVETSSGNSYPDIHHNIVISILET